ncbi:MAG: alpha/beta fold hydrolase [Chloroflexota bacterium]
MPARRPMTPADIRRQVVVEELDLSVDGRLAVVARRSVRGNRYVTHLYAILLDVGRVGRPRRLTSGTIRDARPRLSPDGARLAFVRTDPTDDDQPASIVLLELRTGAQRVLRHRGYGSVGEVAWSPDGSRLAFTADVDPPRFLVGSVPPADASPRRSGKTGGKDEPTPLARRITRVDWRWDGDGHLDRWSHLFVVEPRPGAIPRQLTTGDWGASDIAWSPDGASIAFAADPRPEADLRPRTTIWEVAVDDAAHGAGSTEPREVMAAGGFASHPAWSPDGRWLAAIGVLDPEMLDDDSPTILVGPADGSAAPWALAPDLDRPIGNWADTDLNGWMVSGRPGPYWLGGDAILTTVTDRGRSHPVRFELDPDTGAARNRPTAVPRDVPGPWSDATSHALGVAANGTIAVLGTLDTRAMELMTLDADASGRPRWTTRSTLGSAWQRRYLGTDMRRVDAPGPGGPIETWIASPPGAGDAALPTVVDIHGGPLGAWAPAPHVEVSLLVAAGYRVILPNIRGSASYGQAWIRPQLGVWGGPDADDVHAAIDHVVRLGLADPDRLGLIGLSYGGFMVHWLIGTSDRFRAAVSENGVANQVSSWANSDSGAEYTRASLMGDPLSPEGVDHLWQQSPLRNVRAIHTPLLLFQAESDLRCPPQDNEQLFVALRHLRRTVEYVLYPEESHVFSSSGRPDRRIDRMTRMLDWFDRYLRGEPVPEKRRV